MEEQQQIATTTTKVSTVIIVITAILVFGVAMLMIFSSPIKSSHDEPADSVTAEQQE